MADSKYIAGLIGPTLIALSTSEAANVNVWGSNTPAGIYLNGAVLFVAGLAIVRAHNLWVGDWTFLVTVMGWAALLLGLFRMFAPDFHLKQAQHSSSIFELIPPFLIGVYLTYQAYRRD